MPDRFPEPDLDPKRDEDYPEWQHEIRQAQDKRKAEEDAAAAKNLKKVLSWLGIDADPVNGEIVLGEYLLTLSDFGEIKRTPVTDKETKSVRFEVVIEFADLSTDLTYGIPYNNLYFNNADFVEKGFNWEKIRAALADKLDDLDERRAQWEENKRLQDQKVDVSVQSTGTAEELRKIIDKIVEEHIRGIC